MKDKFGTDENSFCYRSYVKEYCECSSCSSKIEKNTKKFVLEVEQEKNDLCEKCGYKLLDEIYDLLNKELIKW